MVHKRNFCLYFRGTHGYDYQTGGSGMIFNVELVKKLVEKSKTHCQCATPDQPDDMHLGACLANLGLTMIHSDRLHQVKLQIDLKLLSDERIDS